MATFKNIPNGFYLKQRPKEYTARDAAYPVGGNKGVVLARYPRAYPLTDQQIAIKNAAAACGIKKGMTKAALQKAMKECIPNQFGVKTVKKVVGRPKK